MLRTRPCEDELLVRQLGIDLVTADEEQFFNQPLDAVDICSPNVFHQHQTLKALEKGLSVYCEKPLGMNLKEARYIAQAAHASQKTTHTAFNFRYRPGVRQARAIMAAGMIGEVRHFNARFYHSSYIDPTRPISWRLKLDQSGGGALADLGIHIIDTLRLLLGDFSWVECQTRTFINQRPIAPGSHEMEAVDVDDWAICNLGLPNGAVGNIEVSRVASGNPNVMQIEIIGSQGALRFDFSKGEYAEFFDNHRGLWEIGARDLPEAKGETPLIEIYPPVKTALGSQFSSHLASAYDFTRRVAANQPSMADFEAAARAQEVLEAAYASAARDGVHVSLPLP